LIPRALDLKGLVMKRFITLFAIAAAIAGAAVAGPIDNVFGNTLTATAADGSKFVWYYDADGKFSAVFPDGSKRSGTWTLDGLTLCATFEGDPKPGCTTVIEGMKPGDVAKGADTSGNQVTLTLTAGR
jgi:hypothetical protein